MPSTLISGDDTSFTAICRENGWKRTAQRRAVFNCLCGNREHPSVESVWSMIRQHLPDISLDSVYRILDDFAAAGLLRRLDGDKVIRYDSETSDHGHFVCTRCSRMFDFDYGDVGRTADVCGCFGTVETVEVNVRGICSDCQSPAQR